MSDLDALVRRIARHEFPDPRTRRGATGRTGSPGRPRADVRTSPAPASAARRPGAPAAAAPVPRRG